MSSAPVPTDQNSHRRNWGVVIYGLASTGLGVIGLVRGDFTMVWHPVPDALHGQAWLAYACAALFTLAGLGVFPRRPVPGAAAILCALYLLFAMSWLRRVVGFPLLIGTWLGFAEQVVLALGAMATLLIARKSTGAAISVCRIAFGLCELVFGLSHFLSLAETVAMTPEWLPLGQTFWALATGAVHLLGGGTLIVGIRPDLAARVLSAMFVLFGAFVWAPQLIANPMAAFPWAGTAINFAMVGAVWALADLLTSRDRRHPLGPVY